MQDCARALECLADRLDALEARLAPPVTPDAPPEPCASLFDSVTSEVDGLRVAVTAVEGMASDRLLAFEERLRRLEQLPDQVAEMRRQHAGRRSLEAAVEAVTAGGPSASAAPAAGVADVYRHIHRDIHRDIYRHIYRHIYRELEAVADVVASGQATTSGGLERVRTLERAVGELRYRVESEARAGARPST